MVKNRKKTYAELQSEAAREKQQAERARAQAERRKAEKKSAPPAAS